MKKKNDTMDKFITWYSEEKENGCGVIKAIYEDSEKVELIEDIEKILNESNNIFANKKTGTKYRFDKMSNSLMLSDYYASPWLKVSEIKPEDMTGSWYSIGI